VGGTTRNDTYSFSATLLQTTGELPSVLVVWGSDTKVNANLAPYELNATKLDDALYLLNLGASLDLRQSYFY
jgi:hypothetical protein